MIWASPVRIIPSWTWLSGAHSTNLKGPLPMAHLTKIGAGALGRRRRHNEPGPLTKRRKKWAPRRAGGELDRRRVHHIHLLEWRLELAAQRRIRGGVDNTVEIPLHRRGVARGSVVELDVRLQMEGDRLAVVADVPGLLGCLERQSWRRAVRRLPMPWLVRPRVPLEGPRLALTPVPLVHHWGHKLRTAARR